MLLKAVTTASLFRAEVTDFEDGNRKFLRNAAINIQEYTLSQAPSIPQSGHLTAVEMAKLYVKPNFSCGFGVQVTIGGMEVFLK